MATLGRRSFLAGAGVLGAAALGACGSSGNQPAAGGGGSDAQLSGSLTFTTWASKAEKPAFQQLAKDFQAARGVEVKVEILPYDQIRTVVDRRLQANQAPDLFRVSYTDVGGYVQTGVLADLSDYLGDDVSQALFPALWNTVLDDGKPVGVPHHTDCSALVYNKDHFAKAGIKDVPDNIDQAWTWDEFVAVLRKLKQADLNASPFAFNYQAYGAYRWFNTLFQNGGTVLDPGQQNVTLDTDQARQALEWTRQLYTDKLHEPSVLVKRPTYPDGIFPSQKISMISIGDFLIPTLDDAIGKKFEWGATYLPRQAGAATDLGGNAVVVTDQSPNQQAAAEFCKFLIAQDQMKKFCEDTTVLPVRNDLVDARLDYASRPDLMPVFQKMATKLPEDLVKTSTLPAFPGINQALVDNMDQFLTRPDASVDSVVSALTSAIDKALQG